MNTDTLSYDGGCTCRHVRYRMTAKPLYVHCCHCRWCQRETGASFALNAMIEADRVRLLQGEVETINTPSLSGKGQKISRCPTCHVAVWSNYAGGGDAVRFVRVGTLDDPDCCPPDIHIYTASKQPWVVIPAGAIAVPEFYAPRERWPGKALNAIRHCWPRSRGKGSPAMLELRPTCENCNKALPPDSLEARICSYECTFCVACVETIWATSARTAAAALYRGRSGRQKTGRATTTSARTRRARRSGTGRSIRGSCIVRRRDQIITA